jgi:2-dehydropantoate 2-reductase
MGDHNRPALPRTHALAAAFNSAGIPCHVDNSLTRARWKKLVWNIPFNGLSIAAGRLDTAAILTSEALSALVRDLMHEVIATANHLGHEIPLTLADDMIARTRTMTQYKPSSLIDFEACSEVELDAIWLEPARQARAAGHPMPRVEMLAHLLQSAIEQRHLTP